MRNRARIARTAACGAAAAAVWLSPVVAGALCADPSGDGFVLASDALTTLKDAVAGHYDRRADVHPAPTDVHPSAGDDKLSAGDALAILKASVSGELLRCAGADQTRAVVSTAALDFSSSGVAVVDFATHEVRKSQGSISKDSVMRWQGGKAVVINRRRYNTLQVIDIDQSQLPTIKECSVRDSFDSNPNPQDVVLLSPTKGYVTAYASSKLRIINPEILNPAVDPACSTIIAGSIPLDDFDSDGIPQMDQMVVVDGKLFVSLQRLHPVPVVDAPGKLAVIDTATDTVIGSIDLTIWNPFSATKGLVYDEFARRIYVGGPGEIVDSLTDGGIEVVNPATMQSEGVLVTGADVGGDIFDFVIVGSKRAFAIVANKDDNSVVEIDLDKREVTATLLSSAELMSDIELTETGELWVAFRDDISPSKPGLRIFRISDDIELTKNAPIDTGSLPFTITFAP